MAFFPSLFSAFHEIFLSFLKKPHLWWQLAPVLGLWVLLEIYLSRHKHEELGWNSSLANAISLFWVSIAAMQTLFQRQVGEPFLWLHFWVMIFFILYALFLAYISFAHTFGKHVTYTLAYPTIVFFLSCVAILWGNKVLAINWWIILAGIIIWVLIFGLRWLLYFLLPESDKDERSSEEGF